MVHTEAALSLWEELTVRCERHCALRGERLVEVPHDLKHPGKTTRDLVSVEDEGEERR